MERYRPQAHASELALAVGANIARLRRAHGLSMSALALQAGVGKATLSRIEAASRNTTLETLYAIAAALRVPLVELIGPTRGESVRSPVRGAAVSALLVEFFEDPSSTTEIYRLTVSPPARQVSPAHGAGVLECLLVTSGRVLAGPIEAPSEIGAGAHALWESAGEHVYQALSAEPAEAVLIIRHPRGAGRAATARL
jgi:transcriptional regulator with XRE-family HTH domain